MLVDPNDPPTKNNAYYGAPQGQEAIPYGSFPPAPPDLAAFHQQNMATLQAQQYENAMVMNQLNAINQHTLAQQQQIFNQAPQPNTGGQALGMMGHTLDIVGNLAGGGNNGIATGVNNPSDPCCCGILSLCCLN